MDFTDLAQKLISAAHVVISTGAGVSAESGVPTFRDAQTGLWAAYDPLQLATPEAFRANPRLVWDFYTYRRELVAQTTPNPAHYAIAELQNLLPRVTLITQNVDRHHENAGSRDVIRLHGNLFDFKCTRDCRGVPTPIDLDKVDPAPADAPPLCPYCGQGYVRPAVVWFNEQLPIDALAQAFDAAENCQVMLVVGTSGVVYPANRLTINALYKGAFVVEVNPMESELTERMSLHLKGKAGEILPQIVTAVKAGLAG